MMGCEQNFLIVPAGIAGWIDHEEAIKPAIEAAVEVSARNIVAVKRVPEGLAVKL